MKQTILGILFCVLCFAGFAQNSPPQKYFKEAFIKKSMKKALAWQLGNPKHELTDWTNGAFYAGVYAAYLTLDSKEIYDSLYLMGERNQWKPGPRLHHADDHAICQTYIDIYRAGKEEKMIKPFVSTLDEFMATPYKTKGIERITWWWCDALFMGPPAFVKLGVTLNEKEYLTLADRLFRECYDMLYDKEEHLYARDLNYKWGEPGFEAKKEANGKKIFWSRGNGWVMGGLVRILAELPADYPTRDFYVRNFQEMAEKIVSIQQPDGLWRASLLDPASYPGGEASGSGFYCYALAWGLDNGFLDPEKYLMPVKKAWAGLVSLQQKNGMVGWVQPIGADPRKNFSADSWEVYGTGAFLLAGSEVIKLKK